MKKGHEHQMAGVFRIIQGYRVYLEGQRDSVDK